VYVFWAAKPRISEGAIHIERRVNQAKAGAAGKLVKIINTNIPVNRMAR
jgi:hypothetical protein